MCSLYSQPKPMQYSVEMHPKIPDRFVSSWSPRKMESFHDPWFWRPVSAEMQTGFGVPLGVCMERAQVLFFSKISEIFGTVETNSLMFMMQDLLSPKTGGKQFWGNWDSYGNSSVWIGKIHLLMVHFSITMSGFQNGKYITMEGMFKRLTPLCHLPATRVWRSLTHLGWILSSPWDGWMSVSSETGLREIEP